MNFDHVLWRFAISGTLILLFGIADLLARRTGQDPMRPHSRMPRALSLAIGVSILAFYLSIEPYGHAIAGGWGNAAGIALVGVAMTVRLTSRRWLALVRMPDVAARLLFYVALPIAIGSWPGLLLLTLPAVVSSVLWCRAEDRRLLAELGEPWRERMAATRRLLPGIW